MGQAIKIGPIGILGAMAVLALGACTEERHPGQETFDRYCAVCHGVSGRGDGALANDLSVVPADLTRLAMKNDGVFPMAAVMSKVYGYPGVSHVAMMPEFGPLLEGPKIMWTDPDGVEISTPRALVDLAVYLQGLQNDGRP